MGQSTHTGCQGRCQRAYCPIRRDLGSRALVSHALGGLYEGTFGGGQRKKIEGWNQRVGPNGTSHYLLAKIDPLSPFPSEKISQFDPDNCLPQQQKNKKWLFSLDILTVKDHAVMNNQLCVSFCSMVCVLATMMSPILYFMSQV